MGLKEQLMQDYKDAMKSADAVKKNTVNMVRAAIKQYEVDQRVTLEDDADIVKIIKKQVKMRARPRARRSRSSWASRRA